MKTRIAKLIHSVRMYIAITLNVEYDLNSKPFRKLIYQYWWNNDMSHLLKTTVNVRVYVKGIYTYVEIETHTPGMIIGRGGKNIDGLKDFIIDCTNQKNRNEFN